MIMPALKVISEHLRLSRTISFPHSHVARLSLGALLGCQNTRKSPLPPSPLSVLFSESSFPFIIITCFTLTPRPERGSRGMCLALFFLLTDNSKLSHVPKPPSSLHRCPARHQRVLRRLLIIGAVSGTEEIQCYTNYLDKFIMFKTFKDVLHTRPIR